MLACELRTACSRPAKKKGNDGEEQGKESEDTTQHKPDVSPKYYIHAATPLY